MFKGISGSLRVLVGSMILVSTVASCTVAKHPTIGLESPRGAAVTMETTEASAGSDRDDAPETSPDSEDATATRGERAVPQADDEHAAPETASERVLRRIKNSELNTALVAKASQIIHEYHDQPFGTEIPFEIDGHEYVGKIERHYHPEGGKLRPWGYHPGCSLFVVESAS
jgi:hypothetical protein